MYKVALSILALVLVACGAGDAPAASADNVDLQTLCEPAVRLAARQSPTPEIDAELAVRIHDVLQRIHAMELGFRIDLTPLRDCKNRGIHHEMLVALLDDDVATRWQQGQLESGDSRLDELANVHQLERIETRVIGPRTYYSLWFERPLNIERLGDLYEQSSAVRFAESNGGFSGGCGNPGGNKWAIAKGDAVHVVLARGSGDCPAGCIRCEYTYFTARGGTVEIVDTIVSGGEDGTRPEYYRWNLPGYYPVHGYRNLDELLTALDHKTWWMREHAVEALRRLADPNDHSQYIDAENVRAIRRAATERRAEVRAAFEAAAGDPDHDVQAAAQRALTQATAAAASMSN